MSSIVSPRPWADLPAPDPRPRFPDGYSPGIGIVGCGAIVREHHLDAYRKFGVRVVGVHDVDPAAIAAAQERHDVGEVFPSLDALLAHPGIDVVDIATHPGVRIELIRRALEAGKHVIAQKPLALDLAGARSITDLADERGLRLAVNQNGRWAPAWRVATLLLQAGAIGEPLAVTHLHQEHNRWLIGSHFDAVPHWLLFDFMIHFFDITRCWFDGKQPVAVRAREYRTPGQPAEAREPWAAWAEVSYADGASALIRAVGCSENAEPRFPFWIHGSEGTITGQYALEEFVELERGGTRTRYPLPGQLFPDALAATLGELLCAIAEEREPYNSARHNLLSLELTLAACASAEQDGAPVAVGSAD